MARRRNDAHVQFAPGSPRRLMAAIYPRWSALVESESGMSGEERSHAPRNASTHSTLAGKRRLARMARATLAIRWPPRCDSPAAGSGHCHSSRLGGDRWRSRRDPFEYPMFRESFGTDCKRPALGAVPHPENSGPTSAVVLPKTTSRSVPSKPRIGRGVALMRARVGCPLGSETNAGGHPPRAWRIGSGVGYPPLPAPRSTHTNSCIWFMSPDVACGSGMGRYGMHDRRCSMTVDLTTIHLVLRR